MKLKELIQKFVQGITYPYYFLAGRFENPVMKVKHIKEGQGAIVQEPGRKIAAYRKEDGNIVWLSPFCPHRGCLVRWDNENKEWVCPCHRSRFSPEGKFKEGPAKESLRSAEGV